MGLLAVGLAGVGLVTSGCGEASRTSPDRLVAADAPGRTPAPGSDVTVGSVTVGREHNGGHVPVRLGQTLTVRLNGDPGTGYGWEVTKVDAKVLAQDGAVRFVPAADPRPGSGGVFTVRFRTAARGETWLRLAYRRPFEPTKHPAATFAAHVMVT